MLLSPVIRLYIIILKRSKLFFESRVVDTTCTFIFKIRTIDTIYNLIDQNRILTKSRFKFQST